MTTITKNRLRALPTTASDFGSLKATLMFCAVGLLVSLVAVSYGMDLSSGF